MLNNRNAIFLAAMLSVFFFSAHSCGEKEDADASGEDKVTITMHKNSVGTESRTMEVEKGSAPGREPNWPAVYPDHVMTGWFRDPECTVPFDFYNDIVDAPIDLYMGWGPELILTDKGKVARVTGKTAGSDYNLPNPNRTDERWNLGGTDLGIIWEMANGEYGVLFGDTFGSDFKPCGSRPAFFRDRRERLW